MTSRGVFVVRQEMQDSEVKQCDRRAEMQEIDGQPDDLPCEVCSHDHDQPSAAWVRPIPKWDVREMLAAARQWRRRQYAEQAAGSRAPLRPRAACRLDGAAS